MLIAFALSFALAQSGEDPRIEFARNALTAALTQANARVDTAFTLVPALGKEAYRIHFEGAKAVIDGGDANGAMYGALELAERVAARGSEACQGVIEGKPYLAERGLNVFLTLPWDEEKNEPDYAPAALTDPARWWFANADYWRTLLDEMARSRLNWLDIHGTYDIQTTSFPNLYAYFVDSKSFPEVGVDSAIKKKNLAQLNHVIELAHARGVRVSLMSYEARFYTPHDPTPPYEETEAADYAYTREVVEAMIRGAPALDAIGYRIGESGHGGDFFRCYPEAVAASGRDIPLVTRSWITRRAKVVPLARAASDYTVEIKFNGEQWGTPYPLAGGRVPGWHSYSFEDYLSDSSAMSGPAAKRLWPGNDSAEGERWPDEPYKIVWQVRANGTHRIFPFYEPALVRRTVGSMKLGTAGGFTVEPLNAYFPASPRYYTADPADIAFRWIHQRDELYLMLWGRLGYDPSVADEVFDAAARAHLGLSSNELGNKLVEAWKTASRVVPSAFTAFSFGPDHRDHAPELEWGGDTNTWMQGEPFDAHVVVPLQQEFALRATGGKDGRRTTVDVAHELEHAAELLAAAKLGELARDASPAAREIAVACQRLGALARYDAARFEMARYGAELELGPLSDEQRTLAHAAAGAASAAWRGLSGFEPDFYKPFPDRLRMGTAHFQWKAGQAEVDREVQRFQALVPAASDYGGRRYTLPSNALGLELLWDEDAAGQVVCAVRSQLGREPFAPTAAWLLVKPLPSSTFFHRIPFRDGRASFPRSSAGHLIAAELSAGGKLVRLPWPSEATPYLVVPSRAGSTPPYYSSQESLRYLDPRVLDPAKHGLLLIAARAWDFHHDFARAEQKKLLDAVARGMTLLVLQQDYTSGRYGLDWLPAKPMIENAPTNVFDAAGALGLERVETSDVLYQPIRSGNGWEVSGNGALAKLAHGAGTIWLCQARFMQRMHIPGCARNMLRLLELGGRSKPVVVVDAGSEGNRYTTSVWTDFLNAHEIPFLTLGEVIATEQGVSAFTPVKALDPSDLLDGRGGTMVREFLESKVRAKAERAVPATRAEFVARQKDDKRELMRSLGLEPLPERTPLNARITGTLQRAGYTLEKLVYESRPGMPVTAHLYVPDHANGTKLPVLVNPHGHWEHKKFEPVVQTRAIAQALHGYLALVVDSPGFSFEGDAKVERRGAGPHDDLRLILGSTNATAEYVWDLMRGLDYLATRPEADMTKIGITGASGGGLATVYAFAADERFQVAVPVVYATSLTVNSHNGCLCNHVPGTLAIGDRADVLGIRAPAPVLVVGAQEDREFPPQGTQKTGAKLTALWQLFGAEASVGWKVCPGPHDYNRDMRELALGFFDRHLRAVGDGSPVQEPEIHPEPADAPELFCLPVPPAHELTLRDVAVQKLAQIGPRSWDEVVALEGGAPRATTARLEFLGDDPAAPGRRFARFESEPGLAIPCILRTPPQPKGVGLVLIDEGGKLAAERDLEPLLARGVTCLCLDARGCGELAGLDSRLLAYLGTSAAFGMGWDAAQAARALRASCATVGVLGRGPAGAQAALFAGLFEPELALVAGLEGLREWPEAFDERVSPLALQPRADLCAPLAALRANAEELHPRRCRWTFAGEAAPDADELARVLMGR
ncbi:MAG: hypothetical protein EXS08_09800 [Planctomycetes bacterium]|nr:hypothetical protein [Planctomycetota bacterium]